MTFDKIKSAIEFFNAVPTHIFATTETDENYKEEVSTLEKLTEIMPKPDNFANDSVFWLTYKNDGKDGMLRKLTLLAESDNKEVAADACWHLAELYLGRKSTKEFEMPVCPEIALGFYAKAIRLGHEQAKADYADLAECLGYYNSALHYLPEMKYEYDIRKTFNLHRIRMAKEFGGKLPELDEFGLVPENESEQKQKLKEHLKGYNAKRIESYIPIRQRLEALEKGITENVYKLKDMLDKKDLSLSKSKKRGKRLRWLVAFLIIAAMIPGFIMGPGEGTQGLLYFLFLLPCTMNVLYYNDISSFEDYMNAMPTIEERSTVFVATTVMILIACLVLNFLIFIFSSKAENKYREYKRGLYTDCRLNEAVREANDIIKSAKEIDAASNEYLKSLGVKNSDKMGEELAMLYHAHCFCKDPYNTYRSLKNTSEKWVYSYTVPEWFYKAHKGLGDPNAAEDIRSGEKYALEYWYDENGLEKSEYTTYYSKDDDEYYEFAEYYPAYENSLAIECLLAGFVKDKIEGLTSSEKEYRYLTIKGYPWRAKDMWSQFVGENYDSKKTRTAIFREYFESVANSAFLEASDNGDASAKCLLAEALFPLPWGYELSKEARKAGAENGFEVYWKYEKYFNPPEDSYPELDDMYAPKSDSNPWGFKAWAAETTSAHNERVRAHNDDVLDKEYHLGHLNDHEYYDLKKKYGNGY